VCAEISHPLQTRQAGRRALGHKHAIVRSAQRLPMGQAVAAGASGSQGVERARLSTVAAEEAEARVEVRFGLGDCRLVPHSGWRKRWPLGAISCTRKDRPVGMSKALTGPSSRLSVTISSMWMVPASTRAARISACASVWVMTSIQWRFQRSASTPAKGASSKSGPLQALAVNADS
jgi:hypothetical protein